LVEIANDVEAGMDGRIFIERVNAPSSRRAAAAKTSASGSSAVALGLRHESGTYLKFTDKGAALFA
jgi:hypothetical protein